MNEIRVYVDGACAGNPGPGGWAYVLIDGGFEVEESGSVAKTTNQRMELFAAIMALKAIRPGETVTLFSDSKYVVDCFRQEWWKKWEANGWRNASKNPVANRELWVELLALERDRFVTFEYVKGHSENRWNDRADELAVLASRLLGKVDRTEIRDGREFRVTTLPEQDRGYR